MRDIYVRDASIEDWDAVVRSLPSWPYEVTFSRAGKSMPMPLTAQDAFSAPSESLALLQVMVGPVSLHCHLFTAEEIEFDLDPRQVDGPTAFDGLLDFMKRLGSLLGKPVVMTPENAPDLEIIRYLPRDDTFRHFPP